MEFVEAPANGIRGDTEAPANGIRGDTDKTHLRGLKMSRRLNSRRHRQNPPPWVEDAPAIEFAATQTKPASVG
jgi:hypothetical protein